LEALKLEDFSPHVGSTFSVSFGAAVAELTLTEAEPARAWRYPEGVRPPFSLTFRGSSPAAMAQETYRFEHPTMAPFDAFIVPMRQDADGVLYQAIFG
jgi:hypothetical protein